jgi:Excreted virulence factor EspC, type VII ESX diderm
MRLQVDPARLAETAAPLRLAADVAREVETACEGLKAHVARAGSEQVRLATEDFLDAWSRGLAGVADRGGALARMLEVAASSYDDVEQRVRRTGEAAQIGQAGGVPPHD